MRLPCGDYLGDSIGHPSVRVETGGQVCQVKIASHRLGMRVAVRMDFNTGFYMLYHVISSDCLIDTGHANHPASNCAWVGLLGGAIEWAMKQL